MGEKDLADLPEAGQWQTLDMEEGTLSGLEARRTLPDNPLSLSGRTAAATTVYNSRLVMADITERKFGGYRPASLEGKAGHLVNQQASSERAYVEQTKVIVNYVDNGQTHRLCAIDREGYANSAPFFWFYYPSEAAETAVVWQLRNLATAPLFRRAEIRLQPHPFLPGAYWFDDFNEPDWTDWQRVSAITDERLLEEYALVPQTATVRYANKIMQSEVDNPFLFSPAMTNRVGSAQVVALAVATHALSQGQFGQFPLYAFCHDGIWAMEVGSDGAFSAVRPLSRDHCVNPDAVVSTDHAVVFATSQGLKRLSGSQVELLSSRLEGWVADVSVLKGVDSGFDGLIHAVRPDFNRIVADCRLAYDYPNHLLHIYPPDGACHYVLCLSNGEFALSDDTSSPLSVVNDWPHTLVQTSEGLYRFARTAATTCRKGIFLSRPLSMGSLTELKRLRDLRLVWSRLTDDSSARVAVFASNDRRRWWRMRSLNAHSYRWFRIAVFTDINDFERISALSR